MEELEGGVSSRNQDILISAIPEKEAKTGKQMYTERQRHADYKRLQTEIHLHEERKAKGQRERIWHKRKLRK